MVGDKNKEVAKNFIKVSTRLLIFTYLFLLLVINVLRPAFMEFFTTDPEMREYFNLVYNMYVIMYLYADCC